MSKDNPLPDPVRARPSPDAASFAVKLVPIDLIHPGSQQARRRFDQAALAELAASIVESGVVQPVVLRSRSQGYELLAGERRWRASQLAKQDYIPALIRDDLSDAEANVLGLIENLQRESLTPTEAAEGLRTLSVNCALTHDQIADKIGKSRVYVTNYLRILKLEAAVRGLLDEGQLSIGHAKVLAGVSPMRQAALAQEVVRRSLSVRALERRCADGQDTARAKAEGRAAEEADLHLLEQSLTDLVGNRVSIKFDKGSGKGALHIDFGDLQQLQGILSRLGYTGD